MSTRNTIVTAALTALITTITTYFVLDYVKNAKDRPTEVMVPQVTGLMPSQAMEVLDGRKLRMQIIERRPDEKVGAGQICAQNPLPDSKVLAHSAVNVVLSSGPPKVTIPPCEGLRLQAYTLLLTKQGLTLGSVGYEKTEKQKPGHIVKCEPAAGTVVEPKATVNLTVAKKPEALKEVPKLRGMSCGKAKKAIEEAGFKVGKVKWRAYDAPPYLTMAQSPDPGTKAEPGTEIEITCSRE